MKAVTRSEILGLYRKILRHSQTWEARDSRKTQEEREYIREEAMTLFRRNRSIAPEVVPHKLFEAETRMELALHYRIPYPRLPFVQKGVDFSSMTATHAEEFQRDHRPAYMHSYFDGKVSDSLPSGPYDEGFAIVDDQK